jgi:hypothetical protein
VVISLLFVIPLIIMIIYLFSSGLVKIPGTTRPLTASEIGGDPNIYTDDTEEYRACLAVKGDGNRYYWDTTPCTAGDIKLPKLARNRVNSICCTGIAH